MSCNITSGIARGGCKDNTPGIVEAYIINYPTGYTGTEWFTVGTSSTVESAIGLSASMYTFVPTKNTSSYSAEAVIANSSIGYNHMLNLNFAKNDTDKRDLIKILGEGNFVAIVRDKNEKYWLMGAQNGLELSAGNFDSGIQLGDENMWALTLMSGEPEPPIEVSASIISDLLVVVP